MAPVAESLVIGGGGMLGQAVVAELRRRGRQVATATVPWHDEQAACEALDSCLEAAGAEGDLQVWWCAGASVTASTADQFDAESRVLEHFAGVLESRCLAGSGRVSLFFASSAGAVYAGSATPPFTEEDQPSPLSPYGVAKLQAEARLAELKAVGVRVAVARIANLYGPGQDITKPQGLITQLCLASLLGLPVNIYVSLDTLRDYLHVDDAAVRCVEFADAVAQGDPDAVTKIIASGRSISVGALIGEANRIFRRRVPVVLAASPFGRQQARDLRLRSVVYPELDQRWGRTIASGMGQIRGALATRLQLEGPPPTRTA